MKKLLLALALFLSPVALQAGMQIVEFTNYSRLLFKDNFTNGKPFLAELGDNQAIPINREILEIETEDGLSKIILEDTTYMGKRLKPLPKLNIWIESPLGFPLMGTTKILYAVVFYDENANQLRLKVDHAGKLHIHGGHSISTVLAPWGQWTQAPEWLNPPFPQFQPGAGSPGAR